MSSDMDRVVSTESNRELAKALRADANAATDDTLQLRLKLAAQRLEDAQHAAGVRAYSDEVLRQHCLSVAPMDVQPDERVRAAQMFYDYIKNGVK